MLLKLVTDIFQEVGKDIGPFGEKKKFLENFFPKGTTAAFGTFLGTAPRTNFFPKSFFYTLVMWRALKSGYGHFPRSREGYRTIWRKKIFWKIFSQRGPLQLLALFFGQHRGQIFFPKSFFYTLVMWRALESGYGYFPRGREGYRTIWRKKKFFGKFFSQSLQNRGCVQRGPLQLLALPFGQHRGSNFFSKVFLLYPSHVACS